MNNAKTEQIRIPNSVKHYVKIPNEVITATITDKRIDTYIYLNYFQNWDNTISYSLNHIISWSGYKIWSNRTMSDKSYVGNYFYNSLQWLFHNNYLLTLSDDIGKGLQYQCDEINMDKLNPAQYALIYDFEIDYIRNHKSSYVKMTPSRILLVLSYIRLKMWRRKSELTGHSSKSKKDKPEVFFSYINYIADATHISERIVSKILEWLQDNGFILYEQLPTDIDNDYYETGYTIFVDKYRLTTQSVHEIKNWVLDTTYDAKKELAYGRQFLMEKRYDTKKFKQD